MEDDKTMRLEVATTAEQEMEEPQEGRTWRAALQLASETKSSRRRTDRLEDLPATQLSGSHAQRRSSTRSLPSLRRLEDSLIALRQTNAHYSSDALSTLAGSLSKV